MGLLVVIAFFATAIFIFRELSKLRYWTRLSVPCETAVPIFGNLWQSIIKKKSIAQIQKEMYDKYSDHRYFGYFMFNSPSLLIRDIELVKQICVSDFQYFSDHREFLPKETDPFWNKILFARKGRDWYDFRKLLSPAFTQSKMKQLCPYMTECAERLIRSLPDSKQEISMDVQDIFMKFGIDLALNYAYGINCNSFKDPNNEFYTMAKRAFVVTGIQRLKFFGAALSTTFTKFFKISFFDEKTKSFYRTLMRDTLTYRKTNNLVRVDVLHLLTQARKGKLQYEQEDADDKKCFVPKEMDGPGHKHGSLLEITDDDITVQLMAFFFTGIESFTPYVCNTAYELALNPDVQENLIKEIDETWAKCKGKITYECLTSMKYLDMVCQESIRYRGPTVFLDRVVTRPYTIPPVLPHEKPLHLKPGQDITIPVYSFSRDEKHFPNPEKFDPERFNDENKKNVNPATMLVFGYGSRLCIGYRLVLLQAKIMLFYFLLRYRLVPSEKTAIPFSLNKISISQSSENGYWFSVKPRDDTPYLVLDNNTSDS